MSFPISGIKSGSGLIMSIKAEQNDVVNLLGVH